MYPCAHVFENLLFIVYTIVLMFDFVACGLYILCILEMGFLSLSIICANGFT